MTEKEFELYKVYVKEIEDEYWEQMEKLSEYSKNVNDEYKQEIEKYMQSKKYKAFKEWENLPFYKKLLKTKPPEPSMEYNSQIEHPGIPIKKEPSYENFLNWRAKKELGLPT